VYFKYKSFCSRVAVTAVILGLASALHANSAGDAQSDRGFASEQKARAYFTNLELITQDGVRLRFYDDVLKDKVVVINFIYTNCQGACPLMTRNLTLVRDMLDGAVGEDIHFVSISLDPLRDTPAAMKKFAQVHNADQDGWLFLTGRPDNVNMVTKRLGTYTDDLEAHSTTLLAANVRTAHWTKIPPTVPTNGVAERLQLLVEDDAAP
jgi:cytochrome oxidase Cu insertion factor (SCO1/SenC/PrrC family)